MVLTRSWCHGSLISCSSHLLKSAPHTAQYVKICTMRENMHNAAVMDGLLYVSNYVPSVMSKVKLECWSLLF